MYVLIGADTVPTEANEEYFASGNIEPVIGKDLQDILRDAERRIFNIEAPITDRVAPISKCGPSLSVPSKCVKGLTSLRIDLATLANNHAGDYLEQGQADTRKALDAVGVSYAGDGETYIIGHDAGPTVGVFCALYPDVYSTPEAVAETAVPSVIFNFPLYTLPR